jgi:hypothetical protein
MRGTGPLDTGTAVSNSAKIVGVFPVNFVLYGLTRVWERRNLRSGFWRGRLNGDVGISERVRC